MGKRARRAILLFCVLQDHRRHAGGEAPVLPKAAAGVRALPNSERCGVGEVLSGRVALSPKRPKKQILSRPNPTYRVRQAAPTVLSGFSMSM